MPAFAWKHLSDRHREGFKRHLLFDFDDSAFGIDKDVFGVAVDDHFGSACTAGVARPSHVLLAMGVDEAAARGSLRFSLGHSSTAADVDAAVAAIGPVVERARGALARS